MSEPLVSVVVATHDRPGRLARLLEALRVQTLDRDRFEVIVVADGSPASTHQLLKREQARGELALRVVEHARARGPAGARNAGWRAARADLVAFTDDDCRPAPGWLQAGLDAPDGQVVIQGRTLPDPDDSGQEGIVSRTLRIEALGPQYETCNIFYPRSALQQLGGFDEAYGLTPGGEDTDLAWRALGAGYRTEFVAEALVYHAVERLGAAGMLRVAARWSVPVQVFARHPQLRASLYRGRFWNVWHYLMWRSAIVLPAPSWLRRTLLTLHFFQLRHRARQAGAGSWAIPFLIVHDLVECWAVARGALRYRTLVL